MIGGGRRIESNRVGRRVKGFLLPLFRAAGFASPRFLMAVLRQSRTAHGNTGFYVFSLRLRVHIRTRVVPDGLGPFGFANCNEASCSLSDPIRSAAAAMMLTARRAARPLLRLTGAGGAPPVRAEFTRSFLDFFKKGNTEAIDEAKAKAKARLKDEMSRGYFEDISEIRKNAGKIATASKIIIPEVAALKFPDLALESPDAGALQLPLVAALPGEDHCEASTTVVPDVSLVCLSFRASSQKMAESWSLPFLDAFGAGGRVQAYEVSFIDSWLLSSSPMRRACLKMMRKSSNPQRHVVYAFGDNYDFRRKLQIQNLLTGYIYLVDRLGRIRWQGFGSATQEELSSLTACTSSLLDEK